MNASFGIEVICRYAKAHPMGCFLRVKKVAKPLF